MINLSFDVNTVHNVSPRVTVKNLKEILIFIEKRTAEQIGGKYEIQT